MRGNSAVSRLWMRIFGWLGWPGLAVTVGTGALYIALFQRRVLLDITAQVQTLLAFLEGKVALPPTAFFYLLTWACGFFQRDFVLLMGGAGIALVLLTLAKWRTTYLLMATASRQMSANQELTWINPLIERCRLLAALMLLACSLPTFDWWLHGHYIIGQPAPNYWMNGTLLASWPFAVLLFGQSWQQLERGPTARWAAWMLLWLICLVFSKPSYALVFALVYPAFLVVRFGLRRRAVWIQLAPLLALAALLGLEYWLVFLQPDSVYVRQFNFGRASGVTWQPLAVWRFYSSSIPLSIACGVAFPLAVAVAWWSELRTKLWFWYVWATFATALLISATLMQTGEEWYTWTFRFQHYIASYLLFAMSATFCWVRWGHQLVASGWPNFTALSRKERWITFIFLLHLLSGLVYWAKMWSTRSHY